MMAGATEIYNSAGAMLYPKNKCITLNFVPGAENIQCEDSFESQVNISLISILHFPLAIKVQRLCRWDL